ncbi:MAG TPA: hypothetical protein PKA53_10800, partial [Sphingobacterium sp.]|nr:hypothetical protein [Sphingobacterium sp.]
EDVKPMPQFRRLNREQACDLAIYFFRRNENITLAEELTSFAEDQFVIWEQADTTYVVRPGNPRKGFHAKNWITPSVHEQYGFWMPVNRAAGIMIENYWYAYQATKKEIYLAKAESIANAITIIQEANGGDYPTMAIAYPWNMWLNSTVYPAKVMMSFKERLDKLKN